MEDGGLDIRQVDALLGELQLVVLLHFVWQSRVYVVEGGEYDVILEGGGDLLILLQLGTSEVIVIFPAQVVADGSVELPIVCLVVHP